MLTIWPVMRVAGADRRKTIRSRCARSSSRPARSAGLDPWRDDLGISESTVKTPISMLLRKLDLQTRTQAAVLAHRLMANPERG